MKKEKVIIVTGGTGILGKAFVRGIADAGGIVGVLGRNQKMADERVASIVKNGGKAISLIADVTKKDQLEDARKKTMDAYGKVDGLVNAAGGNIAGAVVQPDQDIFDLNMPALKEVMDLNLFGTVLPTQVFGEAIQQSGQGSIVNISSMAPQRVITRVLGYSMAKAAIDIYTKWFSVELGNRYGDSIRMNAIAPGFISTEMVALMPENVLASMREKVPMGRLGKPEEIASAFVFLASDEAGYINGAVLSVDGGITI